MAAAASVVAAGHVHWVCEEQQPSEEGGIAIKFDR